MVVDDAAPQNSWPIGRVMQVYPDSKGDVRRVQVKTNTGVLEMTTTKLADCLRVN